MSIYRDILQKTFNIILYLLEDTELASHRPRPFYADVVSQLPAVRDFVATIQNPQRY